MYPAGTLLMAAPSPIFSSQATPHHSLFPPAHTDSSVPLDKLLLGARKAAGEGGGSVSLLSQYIASWMPAEPGEAFPHHT